MEYEKHMEEIARQIGFYGLPQEIKEKLAQCDTAKDAAYILRTFYVYISESCAMKLASKWWLLF